MPSGAMMSAACLLLRALRDPSLPARHRILAFLCDVPHNLELANAGVTEFMQLLADECSLSRKEQQSAASALVVSLDVLVSHPGKVEALSDLVVALKQAVRDDGGRAPRHGESVPDDAAVQVFGELLPSLISVDPSSSAAQLLRRVWIELDAGDFEGLDRARDNTWQAREEMHEWIAAGLPRVPTCRSPDLSDVSSLALSRPSYANAVEAGDFPRALAALHAHFDAAYGTRLQGGSSVSGPSTPLSLLTGDGSLTSRLLGSGHMSRVHEYLVSTSSASPAGGAVLGRSTLHYALLAHAALHASVGAWDECEAGLAECTRVAQISGDAPAAAYALLLGAEMKCAQGAARAGGGGSSSWSDRLPSTAAFMDDDSADMFRRARARAGEVGLWRMQARAALQVVEGTVMAGALAGSLTCSMPDWLSVDPFTSCRQGGQGLGTLTGAAGTVGTGGGAGAGAFAAGPSPTITLSGGGLGAAALTALTSPTVCCEVALARRYRAMADRRPSLGGGAAGSIGTLDGTGVPGGSPGLSSTWSVPLPLSWREVVQLHADSHASRARMWMALGTGTGIGKAALLRVTALLLAEAADACAAACVPAASSSSFDLNALLDSIGCDKAQVAAA